MNQKLSQLTAPALAGVVKEKSAQAAIAEINNCIYDGADMIDLHLSCLENTATDELKKIITFSKLPILALNYNTTYEGISSLVTVVVNGKKEVISVKINMDDDISKDDVEMLEDMVMLAMNDAVKKADSDKEKRLGKYGQGLTGLM